MIKEETIICGSKKELLEYFDKIVANNEFERQYIENGGDNVYQTGLKQLAKDSGEEIREGILYYEYSDKNLIKDQIELIASQEKNIFGILFLMTSKYYDKSDFKLHPEANVSKEDFDELNSGICIELKSVNIKIREKLPR